MGAYPVVYLFYYASAQLLISTENCVAVMFKVQDHENIFHGLNMEKNIKACST